MIAVVGFTAVAVVGLGAAAYGAVLAVGVIIDHYAVHLTPKEAE